MPRPTHAREACSGRRRRTGRSSQERDDQHEARPAAARHRPVISGATLPARARRVSDVCSGETRPDDGDRGARGWRSSRRAALTTPPAPPAPPASHETSAVRRAAPVAGTRHRQRWPGLAFYPISPNYRSARFCPADDNRPAHHSAELSSHASDTRVALSAAAVRAGQVALAVRRRSPAAASQRVRVQEYLRCGRLGRKATIRHQA